jgi:hypothetical protein
MIPPPPKKVDILPVAPVRPVVVPTSPEPVSSIRPEPEKNSSPQPETIQTIRKEPEKRIISPPSGEVKKRSPLPLAPYKKAGRIGRQRKYEEVGERGESPISELVVYRHVRGKQYPALSKDMKRWYEFFYFTKPTEGERPFNANTTYEQHQEAYERGRRWIAANEETTSPTAVEDSRIVDIQARRAIR